MANKNKVTLVVDLNKYYRMPPFLTEQDKSEIRNFFDEVKRGKDRFPEEKVEKFIDDLNPILAAANLEVSARNPKNLAEIRKYEMRLLADLNKAVDSAQMLYRTKFNLDDCDDDLFEGTEFQPLISLRNELQSDLSATARKPEDGRPVRDGLIDVVAQIVFLWRTVFERATKYKEGPLYNCVAYSLKLLGESRTDVSGLIEKAFQELEKPSPDGWPCFERY